MSDIKDSKLNKQGRDRVEWAYKDMPVLHEINGSMSKRKPLKGMNISACLHIITETANLLLTLKTAGAKVSCCSSNPLCTHDDAVAHLSKAYGLETFAINGINTTIIHSK